MRQAPEAEVVHSLKAHLVRHGVLGRPVGALLVDADASYRNSRYAGALEPMAAVPINGFRPDLLCSLRGPDPFCIAGFEVKPDPGDWLKGLAQATVYRAGVHYAYLALPVDGGEVDRIIPAAREFGVGVLRHSGSGWQEVLTPADPKPRPADVRSASLALEGVPFARRLQLNHPLNYLVVAFLAARHPGATALASLADHWPDLSTDSTRRHAVSGARALGLLGYQDELTPLGASAADLLGAVGFDPARRPSKRGRLTGVAPALAAIARTVLLHQPSVVLILNSLRSLPGRSAQVPRLWVEARGRDEVLARAVFLTDPGLKLDKSLGPADFNPSTVFEFKQVLWHAGFLMGGAHSSAGKRAKDYQPEQDQWSLDPAQVFVCAASV